MTSATTSSSTAATAPALTDFEQTQLAALHARIFEAFHRETDRVVREKALRQYMSVKQLITGRDVRFGLVNNRIYRGADQMLIPYLLGKRLLVYRVRDDVPDVSSSYRVRDGAIITDGYLSQLTGFEGTPIDLESELIELNVERCKPVRVGHVRDMATQLQRVAQSANQADATYMLRTLVAQTSLLSFKEYLSAKNLQVEVRRLTEQLLYFLNTPLSYQVPFLVRILVRNVSSVVTKPKLIDRLWNDTIDLAEIHLRGSDIVNEIRRSTHHAVGKRTLQMVQAYLDYLESGSPEGLKELDCPVLGAVDEEARHNERAREIVVRIRDDLEELMGSADVLSRIDDWRAMYTATLVRCESGKSIEEEVERVIAEGIKARNRWMFYHHIRIIRNRVASFSQLGEPADKAEECLNALLTVKPDEAGFDESGTERDLRRCIEGFERAVRSTYQNSYFDALSGLSATFNEGEYFESFVGNSELRRRLRVELGERSYPEQRLLLYELDWLLEELSYVALRHVASRYEEETVDLPQCLEIIRGCALNLTHDGMYSRQLLDLAEMLTDKTYGHGELTDVLRQVQRNYQHILHETIVPFESMRDKLGLDQDELRISLANMQRFLHDLNSMASFADLALAHLEGSQRQEGNGLARNNGASESDYNGDGIVHLSHSEEIGRLVDQAEPEHSVRAAYGGKGSGLIYISYLGLPTPDGFIVPTAVARRRAREDDDIWLEDVVRRHLAVLETDVSTSQGGGRRFGDPDRPLLLAVRAGSVFSMPGILSTVLFVGMNDAVVEALATEEPWHAYDSYRRFLASYGQEVWGIDIERHNLVEQAKTRHGVKYKDALGWEAMRQIVEGTKEVIRDAGFGDALDEILRDPFRQLLAAVRAVLDSWDDQTARQYRRLKGICDNWQSAVIVQEMVSGNRQNEPAREGMDETRVSLTGVVPRTDVTEWGTRKCTGEFKFSACGEDLVGGLTTSVSFLSLDKLAQLMPMLDRRLRHTVTNLRRFMGADQEIEFTVDRGVLSVLQSRAAEIGANRRSFAFKEPGEPITRGLGIRGAAFRGLVAFDEEDFNRLRETDFSKRDDVDGILMVLENPTPDDIPQVLLAEGMLAARGGSTSHAAIAINGIESKDYHAVMSTLRLQVNAVKHEAIIRDEKGEVSARIRPGDVVSIHGSTGMVYLGSLPVEDTAPSVGAAEQ